MSYGVIKESEPSAHVMALVSTALKQDSLAGLSEMLKCIAEAVDADGCILWELAPGSDLKSDPPTGHFFILAGWFRDKWNLALHNLPLDSIVGEAVINQKPVNVQDIRQNQRVFMNHPVLQSPPVKTFCSVPVRFRDKANGAVNVYRNAPKPFDEKEIAEVEEMASLIPALYQAIRHKVSFGLIQRINEILHKAELRAPTAPLLSKEVRKVFQDICDSISHTFQSVETSIFLEDSIEAPGRFKLIATTWQGSFRKKIYREGAEHGLTGWVLNHKKPVRIFDLAHFEKDKKIIRREYPDITWKDSLEFKSKVRSFLRLKSGGDLPPLSFMAAPILMGEKVLGVIRCCTARKGPYYFAERELGLLKLIAAQIGQYWNNWLTRREAQQENESWRNLVGSITLLNRFVHNELTREEPQELRIFDEALQATSQVINGAEIMDVRLFDDKTNELYFATTYGRAWQEGSEGEIQQRKARRFTVLGRPKSAGAYVFQTGRLHLVHDVRRDDYYSETFPKAKCIIVAPISVEKEKYGVLDIRGTGGQEFPKHAEAIAELLGQQLGLYHYLATTIRKLRKAETDLSTNVAALKELQERQTKAFQDLGHQVKSPIIQVHARIHTVLSEHSFDDKLRSNLQAIRGLCGKAKRVAMSTGLFAKIAHEEPIPLNPKRLDDKYLYKMLIEAAADNYLMVGPLRNITFQVDRKNSDTLWAVKFEADRDLLEQAINTILDNAGKYSYSGSKVIIYWGLTGKERFHISVINRGLPIRPGEVRKCVERGWRGGLAEVTTGEGSGIGLWIVDNIMKAHGGELVIVPTTDEGLTEVKLVFPSSRML
ncbi:MAG: GAF domain-containing protein [Blastocatellia bacterium]|nr:GAF domain-containing protein [Blastocatellia bacterium]